MLWNVLKRQAVQPWCLPWICLFRARVYRDAHSGMSGPNAAMRRYMQSCFHPHWAWNVGMMGRPHDLGNISKYLGKPTGLEDYIGWLGSNFDPSISWKDLEWIREFWDGPMVIKGILDPEDAKDAVRFGADGIVVSNHWWSSAGWRFIFLHVHFLQLQMQSRGILKSLRIRVFVMV